MNDDQETNDNLLDPVALDERAGPLEIRSMERELTVLLPGLNQDTPHPLSVALDYWGRNPHLQMLCYDHDDEQGEPKVCVRYDSQGKVTEVLVGSVTLLRGAGGEFHNRRDIAAATAWEQERDSNPACHPGERLVMPSGATATVMSLRDRYDNDIEQFRAYDETYGILDRLDSYPGSEVRHQVYNDIEQAWEVNPLTAGTTEPSDLSTVPSIPQPN